MLSPQPKRGNEGGDILGPQNPDRARQEPDIICPPITDSGKMPNMKWSYTDSHMRLEEGGWARETTVRELPTSTELAGVNMRLGPGVYRELHWHNESEWAYIIKGSCRITVLDVEGGCAIEDLEEGDLWYFPTGYPHGIQGTGKEGVEFLLVFDDGNFSEDSTFLLTDYMARTPKSVLAKNFRVSPKLFDSLSQKEKYIFQGTTPGSLEDDRKSVRPSRHRFVHRMLNQPPQLFSGGSVRITDSSNFPISKTTAAAHVTIKEGGLREMHWHPNADEWSFFLKGHARVTIFASSGKARTFNYMAGDVGIVPKNHAHYVENIGEGEVEMLEMFRASKFEDFSTEQWLAQTPGQIVAEHLNLEGNKREEFLKGLSKDKEPVKKGPRRNSF
ncbi:putative oxalate decarboxylase/oxidase [Dioszegia hungarica]|uniref:Oxalate decarboxylase/oxidase n=1 Tax=Dioszegia hungarica TaxID=4972 RepID=A0AA38H6Y9_9TREE|nr:putative oxalate decarboxylase/oxidase [Dioszegia hungarica]KAI9635320.1 putative oxalate decarboxylase/oxidase [Dioszegia hungarica]